ncbi:photosystem II assembly protein Psb35 [Roseofilum capinflatum]|uniref:Photosystem II reaction center X protein n=1 Tax=Roseofilum capinflatum BLCC-M114 TaxID=3022440 RepID=A0ABT7B9A7_9CYAN|nr:hypothetical protein [Roseofilum capinflatum]MDJ1175749.1 hypothetical protein [Roseofilum capinflatum BLCC-M114]
MFVLSEIQASSNSLSIPLSVLLVYAGGFLAAVILGSIAWYNSTRLVGWKDKDRPDIVPDIDR